MLRYDSFLDRTCATSWTFNGIVAKAGPLSRSGVWLRLDISRLFTCTKKAHHQWNVFCSEKNSDLKIFQTFFLVKCHRLIKDLKSLTHELEAASQLSLRPCPHTYHIMAVTRRPVHFNPSARTWNSPQPPSDSLAGEFHHQLPSFQPSPLIGLPGIAQELNVGAVYLKDEGNRLGLPSFKILGASWGTFRAIALTVGLPSDTDIETLKKAAAAHHIKLYAATDGNHGRAVARMGSILSVPVEIHVPAGVHAATIEFIRSEGATVVTSAGSYDDAVLEAQAASRHEGGVLVQDFAFEGYEDTVQVSLQFSPSQS